MQGVAFHIPLKLTELRALIVPQNPLVSLSLRFAPPRTAPHCAASRRQEERTLRQYTVVALPLVAWFHATVLPPIETYLLYVYCVLVVRAWTYEYGLNQRYVGGFFTGNRPPVFPTRRFTIPPMYHERGLNSSVG